ncbi:hypothetical protein Tco_0778847 [Tanacetum coccineum]
MAPVESPQMISTVKLPILKKGEYTLWSMRMEPYLINTDYGLWQIIINGIEPVQKTKDENGVETKVPPKTAQAILARQKERKAKSILLLAIPDEYQLSTKSSWQYNHNASSSINKYLSSVNEHQTVLTLPLNPSSINEQFEAWQYKRAPGQY